MSAGITTSLFGFANLNIISFKSLSSISSTSSLLRSIDFFFFGSRYFAKIARAFNLLSSSIGFPCLSPLYNPKTSSSSMLNLTAYSRSTSSGSIATDLIGSIRSVRSSLSAPARQSQSVPSNESFLASLPTFSFCYLITSPSWTWGASGLSCSVKC